MRKFAAWLLLPLLIGCKHGAPAGKDLKTETYPLRGKVISTDSQTGEVTLAHEAIPGFMEAMTMPYKLADPSASVLKELHPGDRVSADLFVEKDSDGEYHHARLDHIVITAQAKPDYRPETNYNVPSAGQQVPDFHLTNQSGQVIHLGQYKGKALLITFIYTRCPLADFCPKMSNNFKQIHNEIKKDPTLYRRTHLLSISFDPVYDSPSVLKSYGGAYTGEYTREKFEQWEFAAPKKDDLAEMERFFNVGVTPGESKSLNHSLSTILIGPDGKILSWYPGGDWKPEEVLAAMKHAVGSTS